MSKNLITLLLLCVAIIHLLPLSGLLGSEQLTTLYGIEIDNPNLDILLRHRAVMFGLMGVFFSIAAFKPHWQPMAFAAASISVLSFLLLALVVGNYNAALRQVMLADGIAAVCLLVAIILYRLQPR